jgi:UPF0755 protein
VRLALYLAAVTSALLAIAALWFWSYCSAVSSGSGGVVVQIPKGAGLQQIGSILAEKGLIKEDIRFFLLARVSGRSEALQAGEFELPYGVTPGEILERLTSAKSIQHKITLPEGLTARQIGLVLAEAGWVDADLFHQLTKDPQLIRSLGLSTSSLEGYLFPDTYNLVRGASDAKTIVVMMVRRFLQVWQEIAPDDVHPMSRHEVVTLASVVEKETGQAVERPLIAGVFLNRLEKGMRLQSDPTVIYGMPTFNGNLSRADLKRPTPYNTYVIKGLPPGPICNPGRAAMEAVLAPAKSKALYFVSKNDGFHYFSTTLKEHNRAVAKYQRRSKKKIAGKGQEE